MHTYVDFVDKGGIFIRGATDLIKVMKKTALDAIYDSSPTDLLFGIVTSAEPLEITIDQKIVLSEKQLVLARNVTEYDMDITFLGETGKFDFEFQHTHEVNSEESSFDIAPFEFQNEHSHSVDSIKTMTIHNNLKVDEVVIIISLVGGQKFVVLDRVANTF